MHGPALSAWLMVALCGASGAYCLLRTRRCAGEERRAAGSEAVMGFGMAAMALPAAVLTPPDWSWAVYAAVFGVAALRVLPAAGRGGHHLHHLVGSLAMVYMAVVMAFPAQGGHGVHGAYGGHGAGVAGGAPLVTGALLVYYAVFVLRSGARLVPLAAPAGGLPAAWTSRPEFALVCRLSMALAMLAMLVTL
ncbi:DUF5134 domain-containing protein [Streptomyces sp. ISL-36]|uniref:DUF5134 domain-containing protein n=1 Tax=Streptomyces sp. ISL-36 TaxID=2819182 RepID=UPI001BE7E908|nr:DUF5134 domain-containing protein [Streptomyces sp. ISL-36]MBT2442028.1 DUF5134 domain-containing protein [Streptomyces sp. ISL-36]